MGRQPRGVSPAYVLYHGTEILFLLFLIYALVIKKTGRRTTERKRKSEDQRHFSFHIESHLEGEFIRHKQIRRGGFCREV